jgi:excinuclease ABC subunit C
MLSSQLDGIAGLGEVRAKRLVKEMKGVNAVKNASREDLSLLTWLPTAVADAIHKHFHPDI